MQKQISVSVRNLIELVLRSGDIDSGFLSARRAQDGIRVHQRIQRGRKREAQLAGGRYESEVRLAAEFPYKEFVFYVDGRADGVYTQGDSAVIEEIKSTTKALDTLVDNPLHWAQAKMYGYMYCAANGHKAVGLRLTYCNIESGETAEFSREHSRDELQAYSAGLIEAYYSFAILDDARFTERLSSAQLLKFPYERYRTGQRELAAAVYKTITNGRVLFAQAPTGTGKTISALFPAIKALGAGKIFYLTAKTITRQVANEALMLMQDHGLVMRSVTLTAKEKICFGAGVCSPLECVYAKGHFDRVNAAIIDIITNETVIRREQVESYARRHMVCPFELALDVTGFCDCIVCDYNHVYDPKVQLRRFFGDGAPKNSVILLNDEAHNLVDRARDMFSASLRLQDFGIRGMFRGSRPRLYRLFGRIREWFKQLDGLTIERALPEALNYMLRELVTLADAWLIENAAHKRHQELLELYYRVLDYLRISELFDERYVVMLDGRRDPECRLLCLDPSALLAATHNTARASVFFSATLTPLKYYRDIFGGTQQAHGVCLPSPFPRDNLCIMVSQVPMTYKSRNASVQAVAQSIHSLVTSRPSGNYFAFFSSYEYMNSVHGCFTEAYPAIEAVLQTPAMAEDEKELFLSRFTPEQDGILTGFVVMGGIFSEGIDLVGDRLNGVAVVGVGLPMVSAERDLLSAYYADRLGLGFEYAYLYPGMNKVMQAAGRVIRTERDRGAVLLIDSRFTDSGYRRLFPEEWSHFIRVTGAAQIRSVLEGFWNADDITDSGV